MVLLLLRIRAELENVTDLQPEEGHTFRVKVRCSSCNEESDKESMLTAGEEYGTRLSASAPRQSRAVGATNLIQKCKFCGRTGTISILDGRGRPLTAEDSEAGRFVPVLGMDCRGIQPVQFIPGDGWEAKGAESGTTFANIDLSDGDWSEYDEKLQLPVGISNVQHEFVVTK
eukprot:SM000044S15988  [mRNA]  locus=s44:420753:421610:+ [translate_table: standard]